MSCGHRGTNIDIYPLPPLSDPRGGTSATIGGEVEGYGSTGGLGEGLSSIHLLGGRPLVCSLGGMSVHACTQLYTHVYTTTCTQQCTRVYTPSL